MYVLLLVFNIIIIKFVEDRMLLIFCELINVFDIEDELMISFEKI